MGDIDDSVRLGGEDRGLGYGGHGDMGDFRECPMSPSPRGTLGDVGDIDNSVRLGGEDRGLGYGGHGRLS